MLVLEDGERGPDDDLRIQFDAVTWLEPEAHEIIKELTKGRILKGALRCANSAAM